MEINWDEAPEWADRVLSNKVTLRRYWANDQKYQYVEGGMTYLFKNVGISPTDFYLEKIRPANQWKEGEIRMGVIGQNSNDGLHYDVVNKPGDVIEHGNDNKYSRKIKTIVVDGIDHDIYVDVYDVLTAFNTTNKANDHAIKKQLATGQRGVKGVIQDLTEARDSLIRAIEIERAKDGK